MNHKVELVPTSLPDDIFNSLPEPVRHYIRFLEARIFRLEKQIQEQFCNYLRLANSVYEMARRK